MSENVAFMESNLVEGQHGHLALTMTAKDYLDQTDHEVSLPNKPRYPPMMMGTIQ